MAINPIPFLLVAVTGLVFISALGGEQIASDSFLPLSQPDPDSCGSSGFFSSIECGISTFFTFIFNALKIIIGAFVFLYRGLTFDLPDAPWYARVPITIILGGSITISIVGIIRGN